MTDLYNITTPFGLLDEETRQALKQSEGPWEIWGNGTWLDLSKGLWTDMLTYRLKRPAPTKPWVDWDILDPKYRFAARDRNGSIWVYADHPRLDDYRWMAGGSSIMISGLLSPKAFTPGTCNWADSLIERPEKTQT